MNIKPHFWLQIFGAQVKSAWTGFNSASKFFQKSVSKNGPQLTGFHPKRIFNPTWNQIIFKTETERASATSLSGQRPKKALCDETSQPEPGALRNIRAKHMRSRSLSDSDD